MSDAMETRQLILDTATRMFADHCDKGLLDRAERGEFAESLWALIKENGFHQLGAEGSGTEAADLFAFLKVCGRYAVPLPMAETLLVNRWCGPDDGLASVGYWRDGQVNQAIWGRSAARLVGVTEGSNEIVVGAAGNVTEQSVNLAGEPEDAVQLETQTQHDLAQSPSAQMALARVNLMAGSLQAQLDLGIQFATERKQFGRSISKFQAIQHSLAVVAAEVAAAQRAADAAVDALQDERFECEVAAAKARVGEATGVVAEQVHQVHGAMGFTHEHRLHHFSRRSWSWRDQWGNEFQWQAALGRKLCSLGADRVWDFIATSH